MKAPAIILCIASQVLAAAISPLDVWQWRNPVPQGNRLLAVAASANLFVAVGERSTVLVSTNAADWLVTNAPGTVNLNGLCFANNQFVAVGDNGTILTSANGTVWTQRSSPTTNSLFGVTYAAGIYLAVGDNGTVVTSASGQTWTSRASNTATNARLRDVTFGAGSFIAVGSYLNFDFIAGVVVTSFNGTDWQEVSRYAPIMDTVAYGNGLFVGSSEYSSIYSSPDGFQWAQHYFGPAVYASDLAFFGGKFFGANGGRVMSSANPTNWVFSAASLSSLRGLAFRGNTGVAVGDGGQIAVSSDATNWSRVTSGETLGIEKITFGGGNYVAVGGINILNSSDGAHWSRRPAPSPNSLHAVACGAGVCVAVGGASGTNLISNNGADWFPLPRFTTNDLLGIAFLNNRFVAVGGASSRLGTICDSADGTNWNVTYLPNMARFSAVTIGSGRFVAVGLGAIYSSDDLQNWTFAGGSNVNWYAVQYGNGMFVAAGVTQSGQTAESLARSFDGLTWEPVASSNRPFSDLAFGRGTFATVGSFDGILTSTNGRDWTLHSNRVAQVLRAVTFANETFVVGGFEGGILQSGELVVRPRLAASRPSGDQFAFNISSGEAGQTYTIQGSANLIDWTNRLSITVQTFPTNVMVSAPDALQFFRLTAP